MAQSKEEPPKHKVRAMFGNGLKPQIWRKFMETYKVKLVEFYGSTEGNSNLSMILIFFF